MSEEEEIVQDEENIINEPDYNIPGDDYIIYDQREDEQVITEKDKPLDIPMDLIRLGRKIKAHATIQRGQTKGQQPRSKKKGKAANRSNL